MQSYSNILLMQSCEPYWNTLLCHVFLGFLHGVFAVMKNAGREYRVCMSEFNSVCQMLQIPNTAGGNDGNADRIGDTACQFKIESALGAVTIHTGEQNFACAQRFHFCLLYTSDAADE